MVQVCLIIDPLHPDVSGKSEIIIYHIFLGLLSIFSLWKWAVNHVALSFPSWRQRWEWSGWTWVDQSNYSKSLGLENYLGNHVTQGGEYFQGLIWVLGERVLFFLTGIGSQRWHNFGGTGYLSQHLERACLRIKPLWWCNLRTLEIYKKNVFFFCFLELFWFWVPVNTSHVCFD